MNNIALAEFISGGIRNIFIPSNQEGEVLCVQQFPEGYVNISAMSFRDYEHAVARYNVNSTKEDWGLIADQVKHYVAERVNCPFCKVVMLGGEHTTVCLYKMIWEFYSKLDVL